MLFTQTPLPRRLVLGSMPAGQGWEQLPVAQPDWPSTQVGGLGGWVTGTHHPLPAVPPVQLPTAHVHTVRRFTLQ